MKNSAIISKNKPDKREPRMSLTHYIRTIPDYPQKGVQFRDITTLLHNPDGLKAAVDQLVSQYKDKKIDRIAVIESRGFLLGAPLAYCLNAGLVLIRKKGKLPCDTLEESYNLEYGTGTIEVHTDAIMPGDRILLVDDLIATGGTAEAAIKLVRKCGGEVVECAFLVNLPELKGDKRIENLGCSTFALCAFEGE